MAHGANSATRLSAWMPLLMHGTIIRALPG